MPSSFRTLFACSALALVGATVTLPAVARDAPARDVSEDAMQSDFERYHPDLRYRRLGADAHERGAYAEAYELFERAAYYGDKPSQGMLAQMLWNGEGTDQDKALAYAWMDLAAERGYPTFLALREHYWEQIDETTRTRAVEEGQGVYARYGDAVAKPRMDSQLRRGRGKVTGSRVGSVGNLTVLVPSESGGMKRMRGHDFHDKRLWQSDLYWEWQDEIWRASPRGTVEVGELSSREADEDTAKD